MSRKISLINGKCILSIQKINYLLILLSSICMSITDVTYFLANYVRACKNIEVKNNRNKVKNDSSKDRMGKIKYFIAIIVYKCADHENP